MTMNKDLVQELKATHYMFARFLEGTRTRSSMGEALVEIAKFSEGIYMKDPEVLISATTEALTEDDDGECAVSQ